MKLSLVIPCYNEEGNVEKFFSEVKKVFNESNAVSPYELDVVIDLIYSELSSSMNYFQMQTNLIVESVYFTANTELEGEFAQSLAEKIYVPLVVPSFYSEYMTGSFSPKEFAGCISLAKVALEG